jgi:cell shape-determining protein MreD
MRIINENTKSRARKVIVYTIYIFLLSTLQVSFPDAFSFAGQTADLMFVFVVLSGYFNGFWDGAVVGFICGLLRDVFSPPAVVGLDGEVRVTAFIGAFTLFAAGITGASFFTKRMHRNIPFSVVAVMFVTFCYKVAGYVLIFGWSSISGINMNFYNPVAAFVYSFLPQLLLNTVTAIPLIVLLRFLGPVSFRNTKKKDDIISDSGEGTWLGI